MATMTSASGPAPAGVPDPVDGTIAAPSPSHNGSTPGVSSLRPEEAAGGDHPPEPAPTPGVAAKRKRWLPPQVRWTLTAVVLAFVIELFLLPAVAKALKTIHTLEKVNVWLLILAVLLEIASLSAYAELTRSVLSPDPPRRFTVMRIDMSSMAVSHVMPVSAAAGPAVAYRLLLDNDVTGSTAAFALTTQGVGSAVVLNVIFWLALLISIPLSGYNPLYGFAALIGVILIGLFAGAVVLLTRGKRYAADWVARAAAHVPLINPERVSTLVQKVAARLEGLLQNRQRLGGALGWASANWLLDVASLWVFLFAFGHVVNPLDLLVAYGLANVLAAIPVTPSGLGVVEAVLISTLVGFHVPPGIATLAVLSWRMINFWLPIPVGGAAYLSLRFGPRARRRRRLGDHATPASGAGV